MTRSMELVGPGELMRAFQEARSMAVVGNAPTVMEHPHGKLIDSYDVVVRFNRINTAGRETEIGTRTDILCVNAANSLSKAPSPGAVSKPKLLITFISPQGCQQADFDAFAAWVGDLPIFVTFGPDLIGIPPASHTRPLTSGTYVLFTLLRMLNIQRLFVTGFTMFGAVAGGSGKVYEVNQPGVGAYHDVDEEAKIFAETLRQFEGELVMTAEVESLLKRYADGTNGKGQRLGEATKQLPLVRRVADGLSWRLMRAALSLRRYAEAQP